MNAPPILRLYVLGEFRLEICSTTGEWQKVPTNHWRGNGYARSILKFLVNANKRRASREYIIDQVWPDHDPEIANKHLTNAVHLIRKVFKDANGQILRTWGRHGQNGYEIAGQSVVWVDVDHCRYLLKKAETVGRTSSQGLALLEEALSFFEAGTYLQGEEGLWCLADRASVECLATRCQMWLADAYAHNGRFGDAEEYYTTLLKADPSNEECLRGLLTLYHHHEMEHLAKQCFASTRAHLEEDGMQLSKKTLSFFEHLCKYEGQEIPPLPLASHTWHHQSSITVHTSVPLLSPSSHLPDTMLSSVPFLQALKQIIIEAERELGKALPDQTLSLTEKDCMDKKRREVIHVLSMAGPALLLPSLAFDQERMDDAFLNPSRLDDSVIRNIEAINGYLWNLYLTTPTKVSLLDGALAHFKTLISFLKGSYSSSYHRQLAAATSEMSQLIGEIYFDLNDFETAQSCYHLATLAAKEALLYDLWACSLIRSAFLPLYREQYESALVLLQEAYMLSLRGDAVLPTRYWAAAVEAEAHSGRGDLHSCQHALERAQGVQNLKEMALPWVRFSLVRLPALHGTCFVRLRQPKLALPALHEALSHFREQDRKRGLVLTDLATALLLHGDVEEARLYIDEVQGILLLGSSDFLRRTLRTLPQRLETVIEKSTVDIVAHYIQQQR